MKVPPKSTTSSRATVHVALNRGMALLLSGLWRTAEDGALHEASSLLLLRRAARVQLCRRRMLMARTREARQPRLKLRVWRRALEEMTSLFSVWVKSDVQLQKRARFTVRTDQVRQLSQTKHWTSGRGHFRIKLMRVDMVDTRNHNALNLNA